MQKIGIIGSGNIGGTLGTHFAKADYQVMFSSRRPEQLIELANEAGNNAHTGTIEEAANFGDVILLSVPFGKTPEVSERIGSLDGKVLIDTNNYYPRRDGSFPGEDMEEKGLLESQWTANYFTGAHVAKAFNTIYYTTLRKKAFAKNDRLAIPFAAFNEIAKDTLEVLLNDIGFDGVYVGDLSRTKIMQPNEILYTLELSESEMKELIQ